MKLWIMVLFSCSTSPLIWGWQTLVPKDLMPSNSYSLCVIIIKPRNCDCARHERCAQGPALKVTGTKSLLEWAAWWPADRQGTHHWHTSHPNARPINSGYYLLQSFVKTHVTSHRFILSHLENHFLVAFIHQQLCVVVLRASVATRSIQSANIINTKYGNVSFRAHHLIIKLLLLDRRLSVDCHPEANLVATYSRATSCGHS